MAETKVLVIDDEKLLRWSLEQSLSRDGYQVITAEKGLEGITLFRQESPDITLLDIRLPDISGLTVLEGIKEINNDAAIVIISAFGDVETAVKAVNLGACDFVEKPFNMDKLKIMMNKVLEAGSLRREMGHLRSQLSSRYGYDSVIGQSEEIKEVMRLVERVAKSDATTILMQGESGTGKDLVAKVIHYQSARQDKPFVEINCTALPENLIESELFGYEKGAFTDARAMKQGLFELADGGTIYLDEIGDMRLSTQAKLLKVIENKSFKRVGGTRDLEVSVRVIAATNKRLDEEVKKGNFREDLYYRLKVVPVSLPPLRRRGEDILLMALYFIDVFNREFRKNVKGLSSMSERLFLEYEWPGNVRELKNVIERVMILGDETLILPEHLPIELSGGSSGSERKGGSYMKLPDEGLDIKTLEKELIRQALDQTKGNQSKAASLLHLTRDALRYRMEKFGFLPEKE